MKGKVTVISDIEKLLEHLKGVGFWFVEDWNTGLIVNKGNFEELKTKVEELADKYNNNFKFKAFNEELEISWDGERGILLQESEEGEYEVVKNKLMIEGDWRRFGGVRDLNGYKWVEVRIYKEGEDIRFIRLVKLLGAKNDR